MIFGEYIFETDPLLFPRFVNLLSKQKLNVWGSEYKDGKVRFRSSVFTADSVAETAKNAHVHLKIVGRRGFPFLFSKYRRRYGLIAGMAFGFFLLFYSQLFVWKIDISGNREISIPQIEHALEECGVRVGTFIPRLDTNYAENILLLNCRDLSSAAITVRGTHITVSVLERIQLPDIIDTGGYYNVVADEDGIILDIDAADGTPEVREGDVVYKGELLINSFIKGNNDTFRPTHARGIVYAAVNRKFETEVPLNRVSKYYTGRVDSKTQYRILGWNLPDLFGEESDYEYFDAVFAGTHVKLFGFIDLPVEKYSIVYTEYTLKNEAITVETAEKFANSELEDFLKDQNAEVLQCDSKFEVDEKNGICKLTANAVVKLNIAREVEFELNQSIFERLDNDSQ